MVKSNGVQSARIFLDASLLYVHNHNTQKRNSLSNRLSLRVRNAQALSTTNETIASTSISLKHNVPGNVASIQSLKPDDLVQGYLRSGELLNSI